MKGNVGGRIPTLKNAKTMCIVMEEDQRLIIADKRGDSSISEFIRDAIMLRDSESDNPLIRENRKLKDKNIRLAHELESFKRKETVMTKIQTETLTDMGTAYANYLKDTKPTEHYRNNWIDGRCKSAGISPIEFLAFVEDMKI